MSRTWYLGSVAALGVMMAVLRRPQSFSRRSVNSSLKAELLAIKDRVKFALIFGLMECEFEYGCQNAVKLVLKQAYSRLETGILVEEIVNLSHNKKFSFCFTNRNCNFVAHSVAAFGKASDMENNSFDEPPACILNILDTETELG